MYIEKNVCDNGLFTLVGIPGKSKDSLKARKDLEEMRLRKIEKGQRLILMLQLRGKTIGGKRVSFLNFRIGSTTSFGIILMGCILRRTCAIMFFSHC